MNAAQSPPVTARPTILSRRQRATAAPFMLTCAFGIDDVAAFLSSGVMSTALMLAVKEKINGVVLALLFRPKAVKALR